ncbi:MAG TPA: PH domain-containing protein [Candidatus Blautia gallistercoris]|uniref:PH domain-containing protein n=1 Tax=Candidatus Blautia gallistercoris TaxID=2838490 RepID=A0A9D2B286_9FIRM|nr:PH domain-containing protein [Candidatus Blautia gallistercoris]
MVFKGKTAPWFLAIIAAANIGLIYEILTDPRERAATIVGFVICNLLFFGPILFRNYLVLGDDRVTVYFGFLKDSLEISDITEVYRTHNPLASTAASLDRIVIRGYRNEIMCALQDREKFFAELQKRNPDIRIRRK